MIRDPSDGSVKEKAGDVELRAFPNSESTSQCNSNGLVATSTSGLPITKDKPDELIRLEKSRESRRFCSVMVLSQ
jgi:hypothetical protein